MTCYWCPKLRKKRERERKKAVAEAEEDGEEKI